MLSIIEVEHNRRWSSNKKVFIVTVDTPDVFCNKSPQLLVGAVALGGSLADEVGGGVPQARHSFLSAGFDTRHVEHDHCPVKTQ